MLRIAISVLVLSSAIACAQDVDYEHARASLAIAHALTTNSDVDSDKCEACDGRGEVGDGTHMFKCEECNGTGKKARSAIDECKCPVPCSCGEVARPPDAPVEVEWATTEPIAEPRVPRAIMLTADYCSHCQTMKKTMPDLIGDDDTFAVQMVDIQAVPDFAKRHGIYSPESLPFFFVVGADGRQIAGTPARPGGCTRTTLTGYLERHGVTVEPVSAEPDVTAYVHAGPSTSHVVSALAEHLARQDPAAVLPVGGLFDKDVEVPDSVPFLLSKLMAGEPLPIDEAGVTVQWSGDNRTIQFPSASAVQLNPPVSIRLKKWGVAVSTTLAGVNVSDRGRTVRLMLKGPDFTVRFVQ